MSTLSSESKGSKYALLIRCPTCGFFTTQKSHALTIRRARRASSMGQVRATCANDTAEGCNPPHKGMQRPRSTEGTRYEGKTFFRALSRDACHIFAMVDANNSAQVKALKNVAEALNMDVRQGSFPSLSRMHRTWDVESRNGGSSNPVPLPFRRWEGFR